MSCADISELQRMVKCQYDWNSYVKDFEPYELEEYYCEIPLMEVFALKFDFSPRNEAEILGKITIMDYPDVHTIFSASTDQGFLVMDSGVQIYSQFLFYALFYSHTCSMLSHTPVVTCLRNRSTGGNGMPNLRLYRSYYCQPRRKYRMSMG